MTAGKWEVTVTPCVPYYEHYNNKCNSLFEEEMFRNTFLSSRERKAALRDSASC
jgi:hypothetical protein